MLGSAVDVLNRAHEDLRINTTIVPSSAINGSSDEENHITDIYIRI